MTYLLTYLPSYLPIYLPIFLPIYLCVRVSPVTAHAHTIMPRITLPSPQVAATLSRQASPASHPGTVKLSKFDNNFHSNRRDSPAGLQVVPPSAPRDADWEDTLPGGV